MIPPRVLAIHAHPDDIEFQCAGTLALLVQAGCHVTMAAMTAGDCGSAEHDADAISAIRRAEAKAAADLVGADFRCLEFRDLAIFNDDASRRKVVEFVRRARPDIVLTAPPEDYHCDHEATSALVRDALFAASAPNYATRHWEPAPALKSIPHLYFVDALGGVERDGRPVSVEFLVDVTPVFSLKQSMLACHASQRNWLRRQHGVDEFLDMQSRWSSHRGAELGVEYAEAFRQYRGHPYPTDNRLLELLGGGRSSAYLA